MSVQGLEYLAEISLFVLGKNLNASVRVNEPSRGVTYPNGLCCVLYSSFSGLKTNEQKREEYGERKKERKHSKPLEKVKGEIMFLKCNKKDKTIRIDTLLDVKIKRT